MRPTGTSNIRAISKTLSSSSIHTSISGWGEKQFLGKGVGIEFSRVLMLVTTALISHTWLKSIVVCNVMTKLVCTRVASTHRWEILVEIDVCRPTEVTEDHSPGVAGQRGFENS
jgi:hypothetical protein